VTDLHGTQNTVSAATITWPKSRQFVEVTFLIVPAEQTPLFRSERLNLNPMEKL
jgi:hypothetical protein